MANVEAEPPASRRYRLRFSLLALLVVVTLISLLLAWFVQPNRVVATALFQVSSSVPFVLGDDSTRTMGDREFSILKQTQIALLKSNFVLTAAIRNPGTGSLPILRGKTDPVAWLQTHLNVEFPEKAEILSISLHGTEAQSQDLAKIVDAVAKAYKDEVISETRQRNLGTRDLLSRKVDNLNSDIKRKLDEYLNIARESGQGTASPQVLQDIAAKRLDRTESEIMRLESDQAAMLPKEEADKRKALDERIAHLRQRQSELEMNIKRSAERSADLELRHDDLEHLKRIAGELSAKLERLDIEANSPDQIRQVQPAVVSPE
jgi:polysaccharide biosynthesis transport protein